MLLKPVKKDIDDLKSPSNRILVTILIIVIGILAESHHLNDIDKDEICKEQLVEKQKEIDSLRKALEDRVDSDYNRVSRLVNWQQIFAEKKQHEKNQR